MSGNKHTRYDLVQMQSLPLEAKICMTQRRIQEWYDAWEENFNIKEKRGTLDESKNSRNWKFWKLLSASC